MILDLNVLSVQQFVSASPDDRVENCVGSTHFDGRVEPPYLLENLWLRFEVAVPRRLKKISLEATYLVPYNKPEDVLGQRFGWGLGSAEAPGTQETFYWDVVARRSGLLSLETKIPRGTAWLWLTYNYAGQNNCYVDGVTLPLLQGETAGSMRVLRDGVWHEATPYAYKNAVWREGEAGSFRNGVWRPGI